MKTKPKDTSIAVSANTTVTVSIKGQKYILTKEEAQSLAKSLVDSVGLPASPVPVADKEAFDRLKKAKEEYDKQRPLFPDSPRRPNQDWPKRPHIVWEYAPPHLDYSKFPPGTLLR